MKSGSSPTNPVQLSRQTRPPLSGLELVQRTGLRPTTICGLLPTLEKTGLINRTADGCYGLGSQLFALAMRMGTLDRLRNVARPVLTDLRNETGETANLVMQESPERALYLDQVESPHPLRHGGWVGREINLERSAAGAALADRSTAHIAIDTVEVGIAAVACAVEGCDDPPIVVSITGPTVRLSQRVLEEARAAVAEAAQEISRRLQAVGKPKTGADSPPVLAGQSEPE